MLKIVKSSIYSFDRSKTVAVGEIPEDAESILEAEMEEEQPSEEELARLEAENRRKKAEEDAKRFNDAVIKRSDEFIRSKKKQMDAEYERIISSANANADRIIMDAKSKTKAVFDAAEEECAKMRSKAEKAGFEAGFEAGRQEAMKTCEKYLEAAAKLMTEINSRKEAYYITHEYELTETVLDMVRKITMAEIKTDPAVIERIAANAAKSFRNSDFVKISLSKGEASKEFVTDAEFVKSLIPFIPEIEVEELEPEDAPEGTVVLDNGSEIIDASVPTQLEFLQEIMKSARSSGEDSNTESKAAEED